jgi:arylsulfatase A-like enzyme
VLDHLKKSGQEEETIIFFTADQGLSVGHHGLMGKQNAYDVSVRVPFVMAGPGIPSRSINSQPIYIQDAMATSIALSGAERQDFVEFQDLRPVIAGGPSKYADGVYFAYLDLQRSINIDSMKLIEYPKANVSRLYDLKTDPQEMHDLAGLREYADQVKVLNTKLEELASRYEMKK